MSNAFQFPAILFGFLKDSETIYAGLKKKNCLRILVFRAFSGGIGAGREAVSAKLLAFRLPETGPSTGPSLPSGLFPPY